MKILTQCSIILSVLFVLTNTDVSTVLANGETAGSEQESTRPDSHAPLGVMGDHTHEKGEWMLSYRFMGMGMDGLRVGTEPISSDEVLEEFAITPTHMSMQMHMFGVMFAPHNRTT